MALEWIYGLPAPPDMRKLEEEGQGSSTGGSRAGLVKLVAKVGSENDDQVVENLHHTIEIVP